MTSKLETTNIKIIENEDCSSQVQVSQPSEAVVEVKTVKEKEKVSQNNPAPVEVKTVKDKEKQSQNTPAPRFKRGRPKECVKISSQNSISMQLQEKSCPKCDEIRSSMNHEMAKLRKLNSESVRESKKVLDDLEIMRKEKEQLQNTVKFMQNIFTTLEADKKELKASNIRLAAKVNNVKKIIMN